MRHAFRRLSILCGLLLLWASPTLHAATWVEGAQLTHAGGSANQNFGWSTALDGDVAVVGYPGTSTASVFVRTGKAWTEAAQLVPSDNVAHFGSSVAIRGDTIAVGGPRFESVGSRDGIVYVFVRPSGGWSGTLNESARLEVSDSGTQVNLGGSVAFAGDRIVSNSIGLPGALFIFDKPVSGWSGSVGPAALLYCSLSVGYLEEVAASGDVVVAGDGDETRGSLAEAGKAFVWAKPVGGWSGLVPNVAELMPSDPIVFGEFGAAVAIDGTTAVVTNRYGNGFPATPNESKGYIFKKPLTGWGGTLTEDAQLVGSDIINGEQFGMTASMSGGTVIIGASQADPGVPYNFGAAYIFDRPSSGWSGTVFESQKLDGTQGGSEPPGSFGWSVAISGSTLLVGAPFETVGGNLGQGVVHVFNFVRPFYTEIRILIEGPIRVAPGVPVEFSFGVEAERSALAPTGEVVVSDEAGHACRSTLSSQGEGACTLTFGSPGRYRVLAHYDGNAEFRPSTSPPVTVIVQQAGRGR